MKIVLDGHLKIRGTKARARDETDVWHKDQPIRFLLRPKFDDGSKGDDVFAEVRLGEPDAAGTFAQAKIYVAEHEGTTHDAPASDNRLRLDPSNRLAGRAQFERTSLDPKIFAFILHLRID